MAAAAKTMVVSLGSSRRRKRGETLFRFEAFCQPGYPANFAGAGGFRDNMRTLLGFAHLEAGVHGETKCWSFQLELHRHPPTVVRLFVVEEVAASPQPQCHLCRHIGWGRHLVCSKSYHFVLPRREPAAEADGLCFAINQHNGGGAGKASSKGTTTTTASSKGHLLHGVVHLNGYGHLVALHGLEGGSDFVSGHQIMDLWDRICSALHVRKVSLVDTARKGHMELRLLHGVAYGGTWFGRWGYRYGRPSYGVALASYQQSLHALSSIPLCVLVPHLSCFSQELPMVVTKYQAISGHKLLSLGDLLRFMLELRTRLPATSVTAMDYRGIMSEASCRWSAKRVDMAARAVVDALRRAAEPAARWVTRQEVRDAARAYIGDTGLLDFVLKSLGNHIVGNYVVRRTMNPVTKVLEYCLEDVSSVLPAVAATGAGAGAKTRVRFQLTRAQLMRDLAHLYRHVLKEPSQALTAGAFGAIPVAVRMVLDIKHFVKDYNEGLVATASNGGFGHHPHINLCCTLIVSNGSPELAPPYETVTLPAHATVGELKWEAQRVFSEMYLGLRSFTAESVVGVGADQEGSPVLGIVDIGSAVVVQGSVGDQQRQETNGEEVHEAAVVAAVCEGSGDVVVDCVCGADDDDGERMACCDICEAWQHTRCAGIADTDDVPHVFLCSRCDNDVVSFPSLNC
uniref:Zinc finger PHD-type domain-containing protein n=1 Tax=Leersia perrieri TaxID=77586 RepID=A0A0D9XEB7_9ORYZ